MVFGETHEKAPGIGEGPLVPPSRSLARRTLKGSLRDDALELVELSNRDPDLYWGRIADELEWSARWESLRTGELPDFKYFTGGTANVSVNCLDRHLEHGRRNKAALLWESEDGSSEVWTYQQLTDDVNRFANALKTLGVRKGDVVAIYMSNIPEVFVAVHACYRIGAIYSVIFAGFSAEAVRQRLVDSQPKVVVVADASSRRGQEVPLKSTLDEAAAEVASIEAVVVVTRRRASVQLQAGRDHSYSELMARAGRWCEPEPMEANEPGFIIYTSGTEAKPKGLVHSGVGFLVGTYANCKWSLGLGDDDIYWCTADVGWLTFPIFSLVGGLAHGATLVVYEGAMDYPGPSRFYEVIERYRVNKVFTAPTALRMLRRHGESAFSGHDISSLELVSLVGEPLDPETWYWVRDVLGRGEVFLNNTYGQSETATAWTSSLVGLTAAKPGSCGIPLPGYRADVLDDQAQPVATGVVGYVVLTEPFPSLARTVFGDHQRYLDTYFGQFPGRYYAADACLVDKDGHYWVIGRVDDVINVSGHRLGTMEMEAALLSDPLVAEAAVIGMPDETRGTVPVGFAVLRESPPDGTDMVARLEARVVEAIGAIARPSAIHIVKALPKTRSGKIMRRLLRELLTDAQVRGDITALEDSEVVAVLQAELSQR